MVEIAVDEILLKPAVRRSVLHDYGEPFELQVSVYSPEEIVRGSWGPSCNTSARLSVAAGCARARDVRSRAGLLRPLADPGYLP